MHRQTYLENLEQEIENIIREEGKMLTFTGENHLHLLFENRKHLKEYMCELDQKKRHGTGTEGTS